MSARPPSRSITSSTGGAARALHLVELERFTVSPERVEFRELEKHVPLRARRALFQCQGQSEIVEQIDQDRLARADPAPPLQLAIDPGQGDRVVQRVVGP